MLKLKSDIKKAVAVLKAGGVVVFPTETAYGLAADPTNRKAVSRIFSIKGRAVLKALPLIAANQKMVEKYAILSPIIKQIVKTKWPGPLTVVAPSVTRNNTIAIRVSSHPIASELSRRLGRPIVSTSANLSGQPAGYSVRAVKKQLGDKPDFYLDVGRLPKRKPSKIISELDGKIVVIRS